MSDAKTIDGLIRHPITDDDKVGGWPPNDHDSHGCLARYARRLSDKVLLVAAHNNDRPDAQ